MIGDLLGKLNEAKKKVDEAKERLGEMRVVGEAGQGNVKIEMSALRVVKNIEICNDLINSDRKEELQNLLITAMNNASAEAEKLHEKEMQSAAMGIMPKIPGMGL